MKKSSKKALFLLVIISFGLLGWKYYLDNGIPQTVVDTIIKAPEMIVVKENSTAEPEEVIIQKNEQECEDAYDTENSVCVKLTNLTPEQKQLIKVAVAEFEEKGLTVLDIKKSDIAGVDIVIIQTQNIFEQIAVDIKDGKVIGKNPVYKTAQKNKVPLEEQIRAALADKNGWSTEAITVTVAQSNEAYSRGSVNPTQGTGKGGIWYAANIDGVWKIIWDGNDAVDCDEVNSFEKKVPSNLIPNCLDKTTEQIIWR